MWELKDITERGQAKEIELGNGMIKKRTYNGYGFLTDILDRKTGSSTITALNLDYSFDTKRGNLNSRKNKNFNWNESFAYDKLDRLTNISGSVSRTQKYDNRGRITTNSELGSYNYSSSTSYKLKDVSLNTRGDLHYQNQPLQKVKYNAYKKPVSISVKDKAKVDFEYGILQNRSHVYYGNNEDDKSKRKYEKHYSAISPVEIEENSDEDVKFIAYIGGDAYTAPIARIKQIKSGITTDKFYYLHRDYLGSILAIIDNNGNIVEQRHFGAWGEVDKYRSGNSEIAFNHDTTLLNRGYTGHEYFMDVGLIHMNGRMYDAKLGRFISPDNFVQEPFNTQNFNRFGYVLNNPLSYVDPSGEIFKWLWKKIIKPVLKTVVDVVVTVVAIPVSFALNVLATTISYAHGLYQGIFENNWTPLHNANKIFLGKFQGNFGQILSRFTWEFVQSNLGAAWLQWQNVRGNVDRVDYFDGATFATNESSLKKSV